MLFIGGNEPLVGGAYLGGGILANGGGGGTSLYPQVGKTVWIYLALVSGVQVYSLIA